MHLEEREAPAEPHADLPPPPPPRDPVPPAPVSEDPEVGRREALRNARVANKVATEDAHTSTLVDLLQLPGATIETARTMDAVVRQQLETNLKQAELNRQITEMALTTVKRIGEAATRPEVPGKSSVEVIGEGITQLVKSTENVVKTIIVAGRGGAVEKVMSKVLGAAGGTSNDPPPSDPTPSAEPGEPGEPAAETPSTDHSPPADLPDLAVIYQFMPPHLRKLSLTQMRDALEKAAAEAEGR